MRHEQRMAEYYRQNMEEHRQFRQDHKLLLAAQFALAGQRTEKELVPVADGCRGGRREL